MQSDMTFLHANLRHFHSLLNLLYSSFSRSLHTSSLLALSGYWCTSKEPEHRSGGSSSFLPNVCTHMHVHICIYVFVCFYAYKCSLCIHFVYMHVCISVQMFMHVLWKEIALWESTWLGLGGFSLSFYVCRNYQNSRWLYIAILSWFSQGKSGTKCQLVPLSSKSFSILRLATAQLFSSFIPWNYSKILLG